MTCVNRDIHMCVHVCVRVCVRVCVMIQKHMIEERRKMRANPFDTFSNV
jgi:hypothetical protein